MKYIVKKNPEPKEFTDWKEQERETLESCYSREIRPAESAWIELKSNLPNYEEEGICYYSTKQLKAELLDEQGFICAFCMEKLENNSQCSIDHLKPKSENPSENTFDYYNLLAVCEGKNPSDKPLKEDLRHCNNKKEDKSIEISPLEFSCEENFIFDAMGNIYSNNQENINAINTIERLGLKSPILVKKRKEAIERTLYPDLPTIDDNGRLITKNRIINRNDVLELLTTIDQKVENEYNPYCMAIKCVLENILI
ncbi:MAG TPA: TIGR02646 family protein [Saprospiraceae bacterium]|nr:TIGR02646 family protein [Saprospiraceae bacterium]HMU02440.1 TIGR02646 family protein [Saprospiraceae bacterium]